MTDNCRYCKSNLISGSIYCTECNHFQNWRRFIAFGTSTLSLIVAIISVSAVLYSSLKDQFYTERIIVSGGMKGLKIINLSTKPIVLDERWKIEFKKTGRNVFGKFIGNTFVIKPMSEANYKMDATSVRRHKAGQPIDTKVILNKFTITDGKNNKDPCSFHVTYNIENKNSTAPKIPCMATAKEVIN